MIRKLKIKVTVLAMASLVILLTVIITGMNIVNYRTLTNDADRILSFISQNRGDFPKPNFEGSPDIKLPPNMSPETPYETRYFTVFLNSDEEIIYSNTSMITTIDENAAKEYTLKVLAENREKGFIDSFRYIVSKDGFGMRISFLDCGRKITSFNATMYTSIAVSLAGLVAVFFIISMLSGKIIKPIAESYEKQKRFITNAGHEIKTPLTIINANADILEMELGSDNESLNDIQQQAKRLKALTNDLVRLARMEESEEKMPKIEFPISDIVSETALEFINVAINKKKQLLCNIQPMLSLKGNHGAIKELTNILIDNAIKYSSPESIIALTLKKESKSIVLSVTNEITTEIKPEELKLIFDRFYRTDSSRNSLSGGYGIGLSMAKSIVTAHGGKINACISKPNIFEINCIFPS